jgi:hypothetical protein
MTLTVKINTDNDAFSNNVAQTIKLLQSVVNKVEYDQSGLLFDDNGNKVGSWKVTGQLCNTEGY